MKPGFTAQADTERTLMCRMPGCRNRWAVDVTNGKVCSEHDRQLSRSHGGKPPEDMPRHQAPMPLIPLREAVRAFSEPAERDDEPEF